MSAVALLAAGCAPPFLSGRPGTAPAPEVPWTPPAHVEMPKEPVPQQVAIPPDILSGKQQLNLAEVVDVALRTSPQTRAAWDAARSASAAYGSRWGSWFPEVNLGANVLRQKAAPSATGPAAEQRTYGGSADLSWLLFNFGGRSAAIEETRQALMAADWTHNSVIQSVVLEVEQAYYQYVTAKALLSAEEATVTEAQKNLDAADERHKAGLATVVEVLQAKTALSQVQLVLEGLKGQIATTRGALATAMGLPADLPIEVELLPEQPPTEQTEEEVSQALDRAKANRPDLAAARAQVLQADAHVHDVWAQALPSISASAGAARVFQDNPNNPYTTYLAQLSLNIPLFNGFAHEYDIRQARADADEARARLQTTEQSVALQVWTSYYDFQTAAQRLKASEDLLQSATESHEAVLERYKAGVGSILDLTTAEAALESARAQQVQARSDWFVSQAQLAHDTGALGPAPSPGTGEPQEENK